MTGPFTADMYAAAERAGLPDFPRWQQMVKATGGCAQPIRLHGERYVADAQTGEIVETYRTADEPTGYLLTACGNRRASRCPACSEVYRDDTFHLIISGLQGGKGVPEEVSAHPRVFATFTAPSFGAVHSRRERAGKALLCRPRRGDPLCVHGRPEGCRVRHGQDDSRLGQPICADCFDYSGAVLWNAHAGELWRCFTRDVLTTLAGQRGISRAELRRNLRVSYAKVAEYQTRGLVHFHAVIRLDGPAGPGDPPPSWATVPLLDEAIRRTAERVKVTALTGVRGDEGRRVVLRWGRQLDVQPVYLGAELGGMTDGRVAAYIAKYATKGAESAGTVDRRVRRPEQIDDLKVSEHARRMIYTCWALSMMPGFDRLRLKQWAHMLGYRGHFSTRSRQYSTTLGALRQVRANYRRSLARASLGLAEDDRETVTMLQWRYAGSGHGKGEHFWAEIARQQVSTARRIKRENERRQVSQS
ncbi:replication initiator [Herbidospora daliensis]|uniref:replication initiator n=1 Tax=Herbidospora daliensis TaxID=295585 RepID=UPI0007C67B92|nr:replication initiator [Herbidospora daliensis]